MEKEHFSYSNLESTGESLISILTILYLSISDFVYETRKTTVSENNKTLARTISVYIYGEKSFFNIPRLNTVFFAV